MKENFINILRWLAVLVIAIVALALCSRMGSMDGVERDPFRGVEDVFK